MSSSRTRSSSNVTHAALLRSWAFKRYITDEGGEHLKDYEYKSVNYSPLYTYVLRPLAVWCVKFCPQWVAPNTITLVGLLCSFVAYIVMWCYNPSMDKPVSSWVYILIGLCLFCYQTLDNMDGQQARRTGNSSPLGQLFDHGCDALNLTLMGLSFTATMQLGFVWSLLILVIAYTEFWFATWDEFHTGEMFFGTLSGPDEGLLLTVFFSLLTACLGASIWTESLYAGYTLSHLLTGFVILSGAFTGIMHFRRVFIKDRTKFGTAVGQHFIFVTFLVMVGSMVLPLPGHSAGNVSPWLLFSTSGVVFAFIVGRLILSHVTQQPFQVLNKIMIVLIISPINRYVGVLSSTGAPIFPENDVLKFALAIAVLSYLKVAMSVISEITAALGIRCFYNKPCMVIPDSDYYEL